jgi:hypothetical protein
VVLDELHQFILEKNSKKRVAKTVGTLGLVGCAVMNSQFAVAADSGWVGLNYAEARVSLTGTGLVKMPAA